MTVLGLNNGKMIDPLSKESMDTLTLEELISTCAKACGNICRYGGHTSRFYSVTEHMLLLDILFSSIPVEKLSISPMEALLVRLRLLTHDLHEALILDLPRPLKASMPEFCLIEKWIEAYIANRIHTGLMSNELVNSIVHKLDMDICTYIEIPIFRVGLFHDHAITYPEAYVLTHLMLANLVYSGTANLDSEDLAPGLVTDPDPSIEQFVQSLLYTDIIPALDHNMLFEKVFSVLAQIEEMESN